MTIQPEYEKLLCIRERLLKTSLYNDLLLVHPGCAKLNWIKWLQGRVGEFHRNQEIKGGGGGGGNL